MPSPEALFHPSSIPIVSRAGRPRHALELVEEAEVVFAESADVGDFVLAHGESLDAEANAVKDVGDDRTGPPTSTPQTTQFPVSI